MTKTTKALYAVLALFGAFLLFNAVSVNDRVDTLEHGRVRGKVGATVLHSTTNIIGGHANAIGGVQAGFISANDQSKIDQVTNNPTVNVLTEADQGTLSGLAQTIDGVALSTAGMRVGLFGQATTTNKGIWITASGAWTRATDFPSGASAANRSITVLGGDTNRGVWSIMNAPGSDVVGTNDLTVQQTALPPTWIFGPSNYTRFGTDFHTGVVTALSGTVAIDGFGCAFNTNGTCTPGGNVNDDKQLGTVTLQTSATASTEAGVSCSSSNGNTGGCGIEMKTASRQIWDANGFVGGTPSDGTNTYDFYFGAATVTPITTSDNGCLFRANANVNTHWQFLCCSSVTAHCTTITSSVTISTTLNHHLYAYKPSGGDAITAYVDGTNIGTISVDIPTATYLFPISKQKRTAGTASRSSSFDWVYWTYIYRRAP